MIKAPFPWFGGKSKVAAQVWERFGDVANYVEPFFGSGAVLLGRPTTPGLETVNDKDAYIANFWRALQAEPDAVAKWAEWPVNEADLHARHQWLLDRDEFRERMHSDPDFYDVKIAGWWVWGISQWIGGEWCGERYYGRKGKQERPYLNAGTGMHRASLKLPHLADAGAGVHRASLQMPHLFGAGTGVHRTSLHKGALHDYMAALAARLRYVRVCCGDWNRIMGPSPTIKNGLTGVFLDPPYSAEAGRDGAIYGTEDLSVAHDVRAWCVANGDNPMLRIALCGYRGEHDEDLLAAGWTDMAWKTNGGYANRGNGRGRENATREVVWFSPYCLSDLRLF